MLLAFPAAYVVWHYSAGFASLMRVWVNLMWFVMHVFSIPLLLRTLLSPWKRLDEKYAGSLLDVEKVAEAFVANFFSRVVGVIVRIIMIAIGAALLLMVAGTGAIVAVLWFFLPALVPALVMFGLFTIAT